MALRLQKVLIACCAGLLVSLSLSACDSDDNPLSSDSDSSHTNVSFEPAGILQVPESGSSSSLTASQVRDAPVNSSAKLTIYNRGDQDLKDLKFSATTANVVITNNQCKDTLRKKKSCSLRVKALKNDHTGYIKISTGDNTFFKRYEVDPPELAFVHLPNGPIKLGIGQGSGFGSDGGEAWCKAGKTVKIENQSHVTTAQNVQAEAIGTGSDNIHIKNGITCAFDSKNGQLNLGPGDSCNLCLKSDGPPKKDVDPSDPSDLPKIELTASNEDEDITKDVQLLKSELSVELPNGGLLNQVKTDDLFDAKITVTNTSDVPAYFKTTTSGDSDEDAAKLVKPQDGGDFGGISIAGIGDGNVKKENDCRSKNNTGDASTLLQPGDQCKLAVDISPGAFGMARLELTGNFQDINESFLNAAPTTLQFLEGSPDNTAQDQTSIDFAVVPDSTTDSETITVKNTGPFELKSANFKVHPSDFAIDYDENSCTNLDPKNCGKSTCNTTCVVTIHKNDAKVGEQGVLRITADNLLNGRSRLPIGVAGDVLVFPQFKQDTMAQGSGTGDVEPMVNFQKVFVYNATNDNLTDFDKPEVQSPLQLPPDDDFHTTTCKKDQGPLPNQACDLWLKVDPNSNDDIGRNDAGNLTIEYKRKGDNNKRTTELKAFVDRYILAGGSFTGAENSFNGSNEFQPNTLRLALYGPMPNNSSQLGWSSLATIGAQNINTVHFSESQGMLYVGGDLAGLDSYTKAINNLARFDGRRWYPMSAADTSKNGVGDSDSEVEDIDELNDNIYVTGSFPRAGKQNNVHNVAYWHVNADDPTAPDDGNWEFMGKKQGSPGIQPGPGFTLLPDTSSDDVFVGGQFIQVGQSKGYDSTASGDIDSEGVWQWDSPTTGLSAEDFTNPRVQSSIRFDSSEYVGGNFTVGNNDDFGIAIKSGGNWTAVTNDPIQRQDADSSVLKLNQHQLFSNDVLFVGGQFETDSLGNNLLAYIPSNSNTWFELGDPEELNSDKDPFVDALTSYTNSNGTDFVVAGGRFDTISGNSVNNIALFEAKSSPVNGDWSSMEKGVVGGVVKSVTPISELHMDDIATTS